MIHQEKSPLAGQKLKIKQKAHSIGGQEIEIEDWWDRVAGISWMDCIGNAACINYSLRSAMTRVPFNDEVLYGKIGSLGYLVHIEELEVPVEQPVEVQEG